MSIRFAVQIDARELGFILAGLDAVRTSLRSRLRRTKVAQRPEIARELEQTTARYHELDLLLDEHVGDDELH